MKITIIQGAFFPVPPVRGGAVEKLWHRLAVEFADLGHEVLHISRRFHGLPAEGHENGVHHIRVAGFDQPANGLSLKWLDLLYSLRAARQVPVSDIIVTNTFWAPVLLRRRKGVYVSVERMPKGQMRLYRRAARLCACSGAVRDAILEEDPSARPRVRIIPNPLPEVPTSSVSWQEKQERILYVGRVHPEKGIELLLQAFVRAKTRALPNWRLELVGPWETRDGGEAPGGRSPCRTVMRAKISNGSGLSFALMTWRPATGGRKFSLIHRWPKRARPSGSLRLRRWRGAQCRSYPRCPVSAILSHLV